MVTPPRSKGGIGELDAAGVREMAAAVRAREISPIELLDLARARAERFNPSINALVAQLDGATEDAQRAEQAILRGEEIGLLHGVPVTIKDTFETAGTITTSGSVLFRTRRPTNDAESVKRLRDAGAIPFAKTNVPEFSLWWETDNLVFGRTTNPWNLERTPGGSSGGEAAAIAAGISPLGIGSDLGGSIRQPAHYCGIVGFKPTHGLIPFEGHWPHVLDQFNHVGPLARSVDDISIAMEVLTGPRWNELPGDSESRRHMIVGAIVDDTLGPVDPAVSAAVASSAEALADAGYSVDAVELPGLRHDWNDVTRATYNTAAAKRYFEEAIGKRWDSLHPAVRKRLSRPLPSHTEVQKSDAAIAELVDGLAGFHRTYDLLLCPVAPITAPAHGAATFRIAGRTVEPRAAQRPLIPFNLAGSPALALPVAWDGAGLPIGVQLVGRRLGDRDVLMAGAVLESTRGPLRQPRLLER